MPSRPRSWGAHVTSPSDGQLTDDHDVFARSPPFIRPSEMSPHLPVANRLFVPGRKTKLVSDEKFGRVDFARLKPGFSDWVAAEAGSEPYANEPATIVTASRPSHSDRRRTIPRSTHVPTGEVHDQIGRRERLEADPSVGRQLHHRQVGRRHLAGPVVHVRDERV